MCAMTEQINAPTARKHYIDNLRWITVVLVVVYHVIYIYNSCGVISNLDVKGIPQMDSMLYFVYPWFMALLFLVAGISSRYALKKRTAKQFAADRAKRLLVPSIAGIFILGWIAGSVTLSYVPQMFGENPNAIPGFVKYLIMCLCGIGPLWFAQELFITSMLLLLIRKIDKNDKLWQIGGKASMIIILLMCIPVWASSLILNIATYRFGIYTLMFLLGYYVFSHDEVMEKLEKLSIIFTVIAVITGIVYVIYYYGKNYTDQSVLGSPFTNVYLWIMTLALLGLSKKLLNFESRFTRWMNANNFGIYVLHYPIVAVSGALIVKYAQLPFILNYAIVLIVTVILLPAVIELVKRIPVLRFLLLGIQKKKKENTIA